jgi:hypothetical protein
VVAEARWHYDLRGKHELVAQAPAKLFPFHHERQTSNGAAAYAERHEPVAAIAAEQNRTSGGRAGTRQLVERCT